jgi:two-component system nitrate/nitrite response regulator NarL
VGIVVLIIDDVVLFREGLADALRRGSWAGEVRTASDGPAAVADVRSSTPDVVLLSMRSRDGLAVLGALRTVVPTVPVVMTAVSQVEDEIVACAEAGAAGFLPRDGGFDELEATVAGALRGETVCSPQVTSVLLRRVNTLAARPTEETAHLTPREREVLMLIERGMTNKQIASNLGIEVRTVKNHVHNLLEKLRVRRRGEAAARLRSARVPAFELLGVPDGVPVPPHGP